MTTSTKVAPAPEVTGYRTEETLFATRYKQGGRTVYSVALSPDQIVNLITKPDPAVASPGNRRITPKHAQEFARYFLDNENWVSPGIILRSPGVFRFESTRTLPAQSSACCRTRSVLRVTFRSLMASTASSVST